MENAVKFGLIGKNISYSFSKKYFENKFRNHRLSNYEYHLFDLQELEEVSALLNDPSIRGLNVTIPYKQQIIPYLDELNAEAEITGAVNCILIKNGVKKGFNTDVYGFEKTMLLHRKEHHKNALILGDGGAAKAIQYVLEHHGISYLKISRKGSHNFLNLSAETVKNHSLVIQCTPVGTFPNVSECLDFPFNALTPDHLVIDLIYNPTHTLFLKKASERGAKTVNGLYMLEQQAEKSWQIWNY